MFSDGAQILERCSSLRGDHGDDVYTKHPWGDQVTLRRGVLSTISDRLRPLPSERHLLVSGGPMVGNTMGNTGFFP